MQFTGEDVANYVIDGNGIAYKVIAFSEQPSVTIENTETKKRQHFAAVCSTADDFNRLIKEK